ncbi:enoyl-CoA hydratase/isomerase family protein [Bradyrhizobium sp. 4]|uniref:enoyl-CoA hydratase/isomerase family protein n=1 Tax=unclassified Bradyrhizobium TaxID=2631580 RepID=UPI001FF87C15|nr:MULTISPECIES: enoyl-CoA hydratase/isomerase family protein [unclassified Bradyrhizobium]MCK1403686.1 enoyl-CoA hydratase/isomerase family protein [Bradyrhizobium sp. 39]MCK1634630.1 enoyl-CoA hydratase/isomerase family protein [Bradyrhizobium sp. 162]MCK1751422.1 enoyl-CoA hydratase/isomerase family protein [Bradyrhizobium sp. 135]UPJ36439.1 enoyl-CoA hydratase/isomerase family protein [Bradyrhizobium sp. 4]
MAIVETEARGAVLIARFNHTSAQNPMSLELENAIRSVCRDTEDNPAIRALVLTGGSDRSFCAGADFNEVAQLSGRLAVEAAIDRWIDFYSTILKLTKPTVAAVGGYAIGVGFQVALSCDWRVGSRDTKLLMWELKYGIACPIGAYMLRSLVGRAAMSDIVFGCETVPISWALDHKLLHELVDGNLIVEKAIVRAQMLSKFPEVTFRRTKELINGGLVAGLQEIAQDAKEAHVAGVAASAAQPHFKRVLKHSESLM